MAVGGGERQFRKTGRLMQKFCSLINIFCFVPSNSAPIFKRVNIYHTLSRSWVVGSSFSSWFSCNGVAALWTDTLPYIYMVWRGVFQHYYSFLEGTFSKMWLVGVDVCVFAVVLLEMVALVESQAVIFTILLLMWKISWKTVVLFIHTIVADAFSVG